MKHYYLIQSCTFVGAKLITVLIKPMRVVKVVLDNILIALKCRVINTKMSIREETFLTVVGRLTVSKSTL